MSQSLCVPARAPPATFRFQDLSYDVQINIVAFFVPPRDLLSLTRVSRYINSLATPALHSDICLLFGLEQLHGSSRAKTASTEKLISAQQGFNAHVLAHPDRARHVRSLAWQACACCGPAFTDVFPLLHNLKKVHLVDAHPRHALALDFTLPTLFPRVDNVKFTGSTALALALPILHSPHRLTALSLDNINPHPVALQLLAWVSTTTLPNLRTLSLRTSCQTRTAQPWDIPKETELLNAWRTALAAVRPTLEDATLGFRAEHTSVTRDACAPPSAARLMQVVVPVFWEEGEGEGRWPRLRTLQLEGMDIDKVGMADQAGRLRAAVPEVVVDPLVRCVQRFWDSQLAVKF